MVGVSVLRGMPPTGYGSGDGYGDGSGYGSGSGDGSGYGSGDGYGDGYGSGYGYGDGSGYGSGYGDGFGYGSGYGDGFGYGDGYGDGFGSGYGSGYGDGSYWRAVVAYGCTSWSPQQMTRLGEVEAAKIPLAFWRSDAKGQPANSGGRLADAAAPGVIHRSKGPLALCEAGTLHATLIPPKWKGERIWIVALHGDVVGDEEKFGCLEREILGEFILKS